MTRRASWLFACLVLTFSLAPPALATDDLTPGLVTLTSSIAEPMTWNGSILADGFEKGGRVSDAILDTRLVFLPYPLRTISGNPSVYWPADTLVELLQGVDFASTSPETKTVRTRVRAVSLIGARPLTVTYGGGSPELWDYRLCASAVPGTNTDGFLELTNDCDNAGTFVHAMITRAKVVFTRQRDGRTVEFDQGGAGADPLILIAHGYWMKRDAATGDYVSAPAGGKVDADCNGTTDNDVTLPATSNVLLGVGRVDCNTLEPNRGFEAIRPTFYGISASHVLEPATQDDRNIILLMKQSTLPLDKNPLAATGLGALAVLGIGSILVRPNGN